AVRQERAKSKVEALRLWLDDNLKRLPQKSGTAEASRYALSRWKSLCRFLDDGSIEIDTDVVEQPLSQLFCGLGGLSLQAST
ncbi:IS66 family transposase, partial [Klebsiella michiganensis]|uniref:IS66 family transposase n=3 Tax=Pseudomonadota TaxID=1224 RepID=UPI00195385F6